MKHQVTRNEFATRGPWQNQFISKQNQFISKLWILISHILRKYQPCNYLKIKPLGSLLSANLKRHFDKCCVTLDYNFKGVLLHFSQSSCSLGSIKVSILGVVAFPADQQF